MAEEELEALKSIYGDELVIGRESTENQFNLILSMKIRSTMSNSHCAPSIRAVIEIPGTYPKISPKVQLRQPRGLDENNLNILRKNLEEYLARNTDMPVLFDVFQMIQEFLETEQNIPCAACPICLNKFGAKTASVCTSNCDHYIHLQCFVDYINCSKNEIKRELSEWPDDMKSKVDQVLKCPVCRAPLSEQDLSAAEQMPTDISEISEEEETFNFNWEEWAEKRKQLEPIYERQKAKGGLINLEEERRRNLIADDTESGTCY